MTGLERRSRSGTCRVAQASAVREHCVCMWVRRWTKSPSGQVILIEPSSLFAKSPTYVSVSSVSLHGYIGSCIHVYVRMCGASREIGIHYLTLRIDDVTGDALTKWCNGTRNYIESSWWRHETLRQQPSGTMKTSALLLYANVMCRSRIADVSLVE